LERSRTPGIIFTNALGTCSLNLINAPDRRVIAAVWYSSFSDRGQRNMLEAVITALPEWRWASVPSSAKPDLLWHL